MKSDRMRVGNALPDPRCICITAPTACGKSRIALELAAHLPVEIVSVDSAMVYRGMDIGTAKPSADELAAVPHHLVDVADPAEPYSAGRFLADATLAIKGIQARDHVPLLIGGTLLYLRALRRGLANLPQADAGVRRALDEEAENDGWPAMHRRLVAVDPVAAGRIAPNDRQRIQRALEVHVLTGKSLTALLAAHEHRPAMSIRTIALIPPDREALRVRIESRFERMVEAGFVAEVERLFQRGDLAADMPSIRAVGYRQIWAQLSGQWDWTTARLKAITATRQLAKRQMTWLRTETDLEKMDAFSPRLVDELRQRILRGP